TFSTSFVFTGSRGKGISKDFAEVDARFVRRSTKLCGGASRHGTQPSRQDVQHPT
ncbi:Hypothetical predicted protein, partial [Paramuricea clavata]